MAQSLSYVQVKNMKKSRIDSVVLERSTITITFFTITITFSSFFSVDDYIDCMLHKEILTSFQLLASLSSFVIKQKCG